MSVLILQARQGPQQTFCLEPGSSETLRCVPVRKVLSLVSVGKGGAAKKVGGVIALYLEGNWMPIKVSKLGLTTDNKPMAGSVPL